MAAKKLAISLDERIYHAGKLRQSELGFSGFSTYLAHLIAKDTPAPTLAAEIRTSLDNLAASLNRLQAEDSAKAREAIETVLLAIKPAGHVLTARQ